MGNSDRIPLIIGDSHMHWLENYADSATKFPNFAISDHKLEPPKFFAKRGASLEFFARRRRALAFIRKQKPAIIIVAVGGNDLDSDDVARDPRMALHIATDIMRETRRWLCVPGVKQIAICQVLCREKWRKLSQEQGRQAVYQINGLLKAACADERKRFFWEHKGMWRSKFEIFWDDGVHFNEKGNEKLMASVRGCILRAANRCK